MTSASEKGSDFIRDLGDAARKNPLSAALIGMGVLWLFTGDRAVARSGDFLRAGLDRIPDAAGDALDAARSTVRSGGEALSEQVTSMKEALLDRASGPLDGTARYGREYADAASEYAHSLPGATAEIFDGVRSSLSDIFRSQPLALGAIGVAIGAGIAAALPTTELEGDYVGETSDTFRKKATAFAEDQAGRAKKVAENVLEAVTDEARQQGLTVEAAKSAGGALTTKVSRLADVATSSALKMSQGEGPKSGGKP
jgi:hypothetical protein